MLRTRLLTLLSVLALIFASAALAACGDDDDGDGGVSVLSPESEPDPEADPDPEAESATPAPKPEGATQVDVTLSEWAVTTAASSAPAGEVYFLVTNDGPDDPHEFVVIKTDLAPDALPVEDGRVPEDEVDLIDEIEPFAVGSTASITLDLEAGNYVLICNIVEQEGGELESHYEEGMRTAFTVE